MYQLIVVVVLKCFSTFNADLLVEVVLWLPYTAISYISALDVPSKMAEDSLEYFER